MRLFLLPVSMRRALIYCERVPQRAASDGAKAPIGERIIAKASTTWAQWERYEKGWQKHLTVQGNRLFRRIPFEEWGLKTLPPATKMRLGDVRAGKIKLQCLYPGAFVDSSGVFETLMKLATERQSFHQRRMWQCLVGMPLTVPFMLVPMYRSLAPKRNNQKRTNANHGCDRIPNIPFFYLCFRAYSHYRALYGGRLLECLLLAKQVTVVPSPELDQMYVAGLIHPSRQASRKAARPTSEETKRVAGVITEQAKGGEGDAMLLQRWNGKLIAENLHLPEMEIEIERAVEQVEVAIEKNQAELKSEKDEVMRAKAKESAIR